MCTCPSQTPTPFFLIELRLSNHVSAIMEVGNWNDCQIFHFPRSIFLFSLIVKILSKTYRCTCSQSTSNGGSTHWSSKNEYVCMYVLYMCMQLWSPLNSVEPIPKSSKPIYTLFSRPQNYIHIYNIYIHTYSYTIYTYIHIYTSKNIIIGALLSWVS